MRDKQNSNFVQDGTQSSGPTPKRDLLICQQKKRRL